MVGNHHMDNNLRYMDNNLHITSNSPTGRIRRRCRRCRSNHLHSVAVTVAATGGSC